MLHSEPTIDEAVARLAAAGTRRLIEIVLSPSGRHRSWAATGGPLDAAAPRLGPGLGVVLAGPWHRTPAFTSTPWPSGSPRPSTGSTPRSRSCSPRTACPRRWSTETPGYLDQIAETIDAVVERTGLERGRWQFAYQSADYNPEVAQAGPQGPARPARRRPQGGAGRPRPVPRRPRRSSTTSTSPPARRPRRPAWPSTASS